MADNRWQALGASKVQEARGHRHCLGASEGLLGEQGNLCGLATQPSSREISNLHNLTPNIGTIMSQEDIRPFERHSGGPSSRNFGNGIYPAGP